MPPLPTPSPDGSWRQVGPWWLLVRPVYGPGTSTPEGDVAGWIWAAFDPRDLEAARALDEEDDVEALGELARATGEGPAGDDGTATLADATLWAQQHSAPVVRRGLSFSPVCDTVTVVDMKSWVDWAAPQIREGLRSETLTDPRAAFVLLAATAPAKCPLSRLELSGRDYATAQSAVKKALDRWYAEEWWNQTPVDEYIATALVGPPRVRAGAAELYNQHLIVTRPSATGHRWAVYYGQRGLDDDPVLAGGESKVSAANAVAAAKMWVDEHGKVDVDLEGG
jgi:hypothetical protein